MIKRNYLVFDNRQTNMPETQFKSALLQGELCIFGAASCDLFADGCIHIRMPGPK